MNFSELPSRTEVQEADQVIGYRAASSGGEGRWSFATIKAWLATFFAPLTHTHAQSDVTGLASALSGKVSSTEKGAANGVASLDADGKVPIAQIPIGLGAGGGAVSSVAGRIGDVVLAKSDVGLGSVDNTPDSAKPVSTAQAALIALKIPSTEKGAANGVAPLDGDGRLPTTRLPSTIPISNLQGGPSGVATLVDGKLDPSQIPEGAMTKFQGVRENQASMLAGPWSPDNGVGDWVIRSDTNTVWFVTNLPMTDLASWTQIAYPVMSVAGRGGAVVLAKSDVGLGSVDNTSDAAKPVSTAQQAALDLKLNASARGAANGIAALDAGGKVPSGQIPAGVGLPEQVAGFAGYKLTTTGAVAQWSKDRFAAQTLKDGLVIEQWFDGSVRTIKNAVSPVGCSVNYVTTPEGPYSRAYWQLMSTTVTADTGYEDPFRGRSAGRISISAGVGVYGLLQAVKQLPVTGTYTFSIWVANYTTSDNTVRVCRPDSTYSGDVTLPAKSASGVLTWVRVIDTHTASSGNRSVGVVNGSGGTANDILVFGAQYEQGGTASEYIPGSGHGFVYPQGGLAIPTKLAGAIDFGATTNPMAINCPLRLTGFAECSFYLVAKWPSTRVPNVGGYGNDCALLEGYTDTLSLFCGAYWNGNGVDKNYGFAFGSMSSYAKAGTVFLRDDKWHVLGFTYDGSIGRLWIDDLPITYVSSTQSALIVRAFDILGQKDTHNYGAPVQVAYASIYNVGHSVAQRRQNFYALKDLLLNKGITPEPVTKLLLVEGDSISTSYASIGKSYCQSGLEALGGSITGRHLAVGGAAMVDATNRIPQVNECFAENKLIILSLCMGVNDLNGRTPAQVWADIQAYIATVKATAAATPNVTLKVLLCTIVPTYTGAGSTARPENEQLNNLIRGASGVYDALCDFGALNPPFSGYIDAWHPTQTTHDTILKPAWLTALNSLIS